MLPESYYKTRLSTLQNELSLLLKKKTKLAWSRFITVIIMIGFIYTLWQAGIIYIIIISALLIAGFIKLVFSDIANNNLITNARSLISICEDEIKALNGNYYHFADGTEFKPNDHLYANDIDIFGKASLYQYINRTTSEAGAGTLAEWLLEPANKETILKRQKAIKEVSLNTEWRQQLQAYGKQQLIKNSTQNRLDVWLNEPTKFLQFKYLEWLKYLLPAIIIAILIFNILDYVPTRVLNSFLLLYGIIAYNISKKVSPIQQQLSKMVDELDVLTNSIKHIEKTKFNSELLQKWQQHFRNENKSSLQFNRLKKILERLDLRYNPVVFIPLDVLLLWDLQQVLALEKWKKKNINITLLFGILGEFEALSSLATLSFNQPEWTFPFLHEEYFLIEGKQVGHPLINKNKRVSNDIEINESGKIMLITGSNMAGKSTYLRSIGVNIILAMAGAPVCAEKFNLSAVQIISSMRVTDNLEESTSTFYAELKKLKTIIEKVNNGEKVFILLDEILRGTNSFDRHTGSVALIKQLIKHNAVAIIATHDVELAKMKEPFPANISNFHFDVQVNNDELYFDYKLKEGICTSMNASILMKKVGIEL